MSTRELTTEVEVVDFPKLERSLRNPRTLLSAVLSVMAGLVTIVACVPLFSLLLMLIYRGGRKLSLELFTSLPPTAFETGGGFGNAIMGTFVIVSLAGAIAIPIGLLTAFYLAEFGAHTRAAAVTRFCAKTMTGLPSILAGVFAYVAIVATTGTYSAPAGGIALSVLMLPTIVLTAEEALRTVPNRMKEAALGLGCTPTQVAWKIVMPTALPGLLTSVMLAIARAAGETAPLLFTALFSNYWFFEDGQLHFMKPTASLAVFIFNASGMPFENQIEMAWAASLILVLLVLTTNVLGQLLAWLLRARMQ